MTETELKRNLRKEFGKPVWALVIYYLLMNVCVSLVLIWDFLTYYLLHFASAADPDRLMREALIHAADNGWGYVLTVFIGLGLLLLWKKADFCLHTVWQKKNKMHIGTFAALLCIFLSGQLIFQLLAEVMEVIFNIFGLSVTDSMEAAAADMDSFSMLLYGGILAPISEEILFRGLILRSLEPRGKKFAIFASAFLFGIFHGNIVQSPYAFAVGLVLGYTAAEYSIFWSILLHAINNLGLGYLLPKALDFLPGALPDLIIWGIILLFSVAAVIILIVKHRQIGQYLFERPIHPLCLKSFFSSTAVIVLIVLMVSNMIVPFVMQLVNNILN